ncbi:hypothetical protein IKE13_03005 [Candidatus Saccharibacteria bacterium]|nr:hypothetical protein [Candidatus Saccharibacteria bacterium]
MSKQAVRKEKEAGPVEPAKATPSDKVDNEIRLEDLKTEVAQKVKEIQELEKAEAERKAEEERKAEAEAKEKRAKTDKLKDLAQSYEGVGRAYKYYDPVTKTYGLSSDIWKAKQISNGNYEPIWVWYATGEIDHVLSKDELEEYLP